MILPNAPPLGMQQRIEPILVCSANSICYHSANPNLTNSLSCLLKNMRQCSTPQPSNTDKDWSISQFSRISPVSLYYSLWCSMCCLVCSKTRALIIVLKNKKRNLLPPLYLTLVLLCDLTHITWRFPAETS